MSKMQHQAPSFDARGGRPANFFTPDEMRSLLSEMTVERVETVREPEAHGGRPHEHHLLWLLATNLARQSVHYRAWRCIIGALVCIRGSLAR